MKYLAIAGGAAVILLLAYTKSTRSSSYWIDTAAYKKATLKKNAGLLRCSPDWSNYSDTISEMQDIGPLPGTGKHVWKINTTNDSAQFYFNQGINLYYGFHIVEALPSFKKALRFDSTCAMLYWAVALAYGPNINDFGYTTPGDALLAVSKANEFINTAFPNEKGLIEAIQAHYAADSTRPRVILNQQYADKMKTLYEKFPNDAEIATLYADAIMNMHPWDLWDHNGKEKPWTPALISVLENTIKKYPEHPGANHYYIHTMEASPFAAKAKASAERLGRLAPGLSHMVHMPSHIYIRTGEYDKGIQVNISAVQTFYNYKKIFPSVVDNVFLYEYHNRHMQAACSMNMHDYSRAIKDAMDCRNTIDTSALSAEAPLGNYIQYMYATPQLTMITFEKWAAILAEPAIAENHHYGRLIQEFAKGMAYANTGNLEKAKSSLELIETILHEPDMAIVLTPFNAPVTGGTIAKYILMGTIAGKQHKLTEAILDFKKAVKIEDSLVYQEPRDWLIPARHYLGNALLKEKNYRAAEKVFLKDLTYQPNNYISVTALKKTK